MGEETLVYFNDNDTLSVSSCNNVLGKIASPQPSTPKRKTGLLYTLNDIPPWHTSLLCGFQIFILAFGIFSFPLILAPKLCIPDDEVGNVARTNLIGTLYFVSGINTFLQTTFGTRLPIVQGISGTHIPPIFVLLALPHNQCPPPLPEGFMNSSVTLYNDTDGEIVDGTELWQRRMRELQGALAVSSILEILIGLFGIVGFLLKYIGPVTVAPTIMLIGLSLIDLCVDLAKAQWGIAILVFSIVVVSSQYLHEVTIPFPSYNREEKKWHTTRVRFFALCSILIALLVGYILCLVLTVTDVVPQDRSHHAYSVRIDARSSVIKTAPWFRFPYPGQWGLPTATIAGFVAMLSAVIASVIETIGDYYACADGSGAPPPPSHAINRGIFVEGVGCVISAMVGSGVATTSFATSVAAIAITKVGSRRVGQVAGIVFICFGMFGKFGALFVTIPNPVLGGLLLVVFGALVSTGLQNLAFVDLNVRRNLFIIGTTIFSALAITHWSKSNPNAIHTGISILDQVITVLLQSSVFLGCLIAMFFDNTIPGGSRKSGKDAWTKIEDEEISEKELEECYNLPFSTSFCGLFRRLIPIMPGYKSGEEKVAEAKKRPVPNRDDIPLAILDSQKESFEDE